MLNQQPSSRAEWHNAVDLWLTGDLTDEFAWHWLRPECTLLRDAASILKGAGQATAARQQTLAFCPTDLEKLMELLGDQSMEAAKRLYQRQTDEDDRRVSRAQAQIQALTYGILAADKLLVWFRTREQPALDAFLDEAQNCVAQCQKAWPLAWTEVPPVTGLPATSVADDPWRQLRDQTNVTPPGFLSCRRLVHYLLAGVHKPDDAEDNSFTATMLLYDEFQNEGRAHRLEISTCAEEAFGFYLDPVSLGLMVVDDSMLASLNHAWAINSDHLAIQVPLGKARHALAIRLAPQVCSCFCLDGESAGVLFTCAIYGAARGRPIDLGATVTAAIDVSNPHRLQSVSELSIRPKLEAARKAGISRVVLQKEQYKKFPSHAGLKLLPAETLEEACELLTGGAIKEEILLEFSRRQLEKWAKERKDPLDADRLTHYVEPHYALLPEGERPMDSSSRIGQTGPDGKPLRDKYQRVAGQGEDELANLVAAIHPETHLDWRLCLTEDAGSGKSIFTRRLVAYLSSPQGRKHLCGDKAILAVRWERDWPEDIRGGLAEQMESLCGKQGVDPTAVVDWALTNKRVWLILDALDQIGDTAQDVAHADPRIRNLIKFLKTDEGRNCRVVMTTRSYEVTLKKENLFLLGKWRFARIEGFDESQQDAYLADLNLDELIPNRAEVADLLRIPVVLRLIRDMCEHGEVQSFKNRGELYFRATHEMLRRAVTRRSPEFVAEHIARLVHILASAAFEMMCKEMYDYRATGQQVARVRSGAAIRSGAQEQDWRMVKVASDLTDRCILEGFTQEIMSWKHRGMMEFYCGMYLARYAKPECVAAAAPFAPDPQWKWAWQLAIEIPEESNEQDGLAAVSEVRAASLAPLFAPLTRDAVKKRHSRPTQLMWRCWELMESTDSGRNSIARFQREYQEQLRHRQVRPLEIDFVKIPDRDLCVARYTVTNIQYEIFDVLYVRSEESLDDNCPAIVSWYEAWCFAKYVGWVTVNGERYRVELPLESEWEHACRAGSTTDYFYGDDKELWELEKYAWYEANSEGRAHPVGEKLPNAWGIYDMHGNVWEWCQDWYYDDSNSVRAVRGGGWEDHGRNCSSANRYRFNPEFRSLFPNDGFRLAAVPWSRPVRR